MLVNRTFLTPDSPVVQTIAEGFHMPVVLAQAWTEMTLAQPHGVETVHDMMERCVEAADERGAASMAARYRSALSRFDTMARGGVEAPEAAAAAAIEHGTLCPLDANMERLGPKGAGQKAPGPAAGRGLVMPPLPVHDGGGGWRHAPD
ncbi:hypothetical protein [Roseospira goensis]|uniref:Uncharacterized protein n=1 Tax=Roseospira goensis TaxID=391922 RepID=A0A7W6WJP5_9PROT|nr:hypothetical protein [Roseospira goensis]MBB4285496.1 hypothetical protein [Roseospira goensis]